ncbi:TPA: histidinol-phosphate transaminase, partial [Streptococcus pneumoniae]
MTFRPGLEQVAAYKPGKPAPADASGRSIKLSSNENPYEPLPAVLAHLTRVLPASVSRYPNLAAPELAAALAARFDVAPENLAFGSGSVEVAGQLVHAMTGPGDEVMFAWRSFEAYPILARVAGATPVQVPLLADARHDLDAMAAAVTEHTKLIFVCNPNNPTGTVISRAELDRFLERVPERVLVVIDEAYVHFDRDPDSPSGIEYFRRYPNVAVLHTFSKAYGLAGLRVGYAIAQPEVAEQLRKVWVPFAVTHLAQEAAVASLAAEDELQERIDSIVVERERLYAALRELGLPIVPSQANFVWLETGAASLAVVELFESKGIATRGFADAGVRISIGTPAENDAVIAAAGEVPELLR